MQTMEQWKYWCLDSFIFLGLIECDVWFSIIVLKKATPQLWNKHRPQIITAPIAVLKLSKWSILTFALKKRACLIIIRGQPLLKIVPNNAPQIWRRKTAKLYNILFWFCVSNWKSCIDSRFFFHIFSFV